MNRENNQNIKGFLMFILSLIPGCAHMYLGLMKRGIQLLLSFCLLVGLASEVYGLDFILIPVIAVLFAYSFFDGYSCLRNIKAGNTVEDESVIEGLDSITKILKNGYWIGVVLIILGVAIAFQNMSYVFDYDGIYYDYYRTIRRFVPALVLFLFGIFLMVKGNKQRKLRKKEKQNDLIE